MKDTSDADCDDFDMQSNDGTKFVSKKTKTNEEEAFGLKKRGKTVDEADPTVNFLNGRNYSPSFYTLLETRKVLPAW